MRIRWILFIFVTFGAGLWAFATGQDMARIEAERLQEIVHGLGDENLRLRDEIAGLRNFARDSNQRLADPDRFAPTAAGIAPSALEIEQSILDLVRARVQQGIPIERLAEVISAATAGRNCEETVETAEFIVKTELSNSDFNSASLAHNRIVVKASGTAATDRTGRPQRWFDPALPVRIEFTHISGVTSTATGVLPFQHSVLADALEYRFLLAMGDTSFVFVTAEICNLL